MKRQQRTVGAIVKIPLENGCHSYARILQTRLAFYDICTKKDLLLEEIIEKPILFISVVYDFAITKGFWLKIGKKLPLEEHLQKTTPLYTEDLLTGKYLIYDGGKQVVATKDEIKGLESYTVWSPEGIEKRLNDYFANRKNEFVEDMKAGRQISGMFERALLRKKELRAQNEKHL